MNKWTQRYLNLAKDVASWSKDPSSKIGCVAVGNDNSVLAQGYNGFPRGICDSSHRLNDRKTKYQYVVHSEQNCIYNACLNGVSLKDSTLYIYGLPICSECAKGVIQVGVTKVICQYGDINSQWDDSFGLAKEMFREAGVICLSYDFNGKPK